MSVIFISGSLNLSVIIDAQLVIWFVWPLLPVYIIFLIGSIAETNRAPFDLAEAESELVSGFMTEHAAVIFVFFFLAEYASIVLMCILNSILFLGGYLYQSWSLFDIILEIFLDIYRYIDFDGYFHIIVGRDLRQYGYLEDNWDTLRNGLKNCGILGLKSCIMIFIFIWVRASLPRIRFDQLMSFCWTVLLPIVIAFIILVTCILYSFDIIVSNIALL